ncbi:uncharacterized protein N7477_009052 [Penicillium maclennaniae]|uniref:uncharacterized protein n=1 Tax=Penicillium maclennaniae TaxID=1343394 RepID=UPI002541A5B9|nr:uncharacterized protein N7477_009052 [Penicillium maclennaniae]KAJ5661436.1 hypothetical protein N7477_009052 [Penicillium maclennaniae]
MADVDHGSEPNHHADSPDPEKAPVDASAEAPPVLPDDKPVLTEQTEWQEVMEEAVEKQEEQASPNIEGENENKPEVPPKDDGEPTRDEHEQQKAGAPPTIQEPERTEDTGQESRMRSDSRSTTATFTTQRSGAVSSTVFIVTALDTIGASREARKSKELEDAVQVALSNVRSTDGQPIDPELIFRPLHLASKTLSVPLQVTALDCIGKLITYSYFAFPSAESANEATPEKPPLIERAIDAICDCFENEATPNEIQQQIIKSLLAAVLNDRVVVHGAGLLKAVRQIYNIFIYSKSSQNQQIAQGSLTQMVSTVFDRVRVRLDLKELRTREVEKPGSGLDASASDVGQMSEAASVSVADQPVTKEPNSEKLTLQSFESPKEVTAVNDNVPTTVTRAKLSRNTRSMSGIPEERDDDSSAEDEVDEIYVKDSFLVFRALCKLSHKVLGHDQQQDIKSQNMRSKVLSLHLIHYLINNHINTFTSPLAAIKNSSTSTEAMTLLQAVRPHLCLSLSRNGSSAVPQVFKVCCEIFWLMLKDMRVMMKKELEVFMKEIYLAILEKRAAPLVPEAQALESLVEVLRSLDNWGAQRDDQPMQPADPSKSMDNSRESLDTNIIASPRSEALDTGRSTPLPDDDPNQMEKVKQRKIALMNATQQFNFKPKRGIKLFLQEGFIRSDAPDDIAAFLLRNDRLDKAMLGEYLGEGEPENIAIMHSFVDAMDFTKRRFVESLRSFLQHFRLPGEAQKIDRFMLKFAERYTTQNPNAFANADTAYVLAYSVIMLNTDQHSAKIKGPRMTKEDFIKNNRGINDSQDLPSEYLVSIFDEIANNEIVLDTEREHAANIGLQPSTSTGLATRAGQVFATVGRDIQGEKYAQASEEMANKTEQLYRSLIRAQRKTAVRDALSRFIPATSVRHVGSMFNVTWMSFLSGLSAPMRDTQNIETIRLCMEGLKLSIRISCAFDLETPRVAFVTALAKFTNLGNVREMQTKNFEALKSLLDVALTEGNHLRTSWREILTCVSQLDRLQLLSDGVDEGSLPDVSRAPSTLDSPRKSMQSTRRSRPRSVNGPTAFRAEVAQESRSADMVRGVDRIFTNTANLSHEAIIDFVRALSEVSWQEIQSSGHSDSSRTYSLQKLVEISYYNMTRVRIEWSKIWEVLGQHFNQVGCHSNTTVVFFALDSLRQLSMRFMEIGELPGFKFQKDFLKPFEHVMANSTTAAVKDMILRCLIQMVQARGDNIRSGWKTMFGVFTVAAREPYEGIVNMAFDHVTKIYNERFGVVITQGAFADLIVCLTEFSKNSKFQKKSLQAIELLKSTVTKMLRTPECPLSHRGDSAPKLPEEGTNLAKQLTRQSKEEQFWYPILIAFQDVLMTGDDLEVRSRALTYLFDTLIRHGGDFPRDFWDVLWRQLLCPIFVVLQSKSEMSKVPNHEDLSVWLSTTMIQALRNMITLFTHYFDALEYMLGRFLELLTLCICQENDTIARIGSNCLQQLILQNVSKFREEHWTQIVGAFVELFSRTTAYELFTAAASVNKLTDAVSTNGDIAQASEAATEISAELPEALQPNGSHSTTTLADGGDPPAQSEARAELEDYRPQADAQQQPAAVTVARRRFFNRIITNCVLQLLMIETVHELFSNDNVYAQIPSHELLRLMGLLKKSYQFAKKFNEDKDLRMQLWRQGFMKQPPNLLKQESGSAATYVHILFRMYHDEREERQSSRAETEAALIPLCADIIRSFVRLDEETQNRNIVAWRPVVVDVIDGYNNFPENGFDKHIETFYPLGVELLSRDLNPEIRVALQSLLRRIGEVRLGVSSPNPLDAPISPRSSVSQKGSRRDSQLSS